MRHVTVAFNNITRWRPNLTAKTKDFQVATTYERRAGWERHLEKVSPFATQLDCDCRRQRRGAGRGPCGVQAESQQTKGTLRRLKAAIHDEDVSARTTFLPQEDLEVPWRGPRPQEPTSAPRARPRTKHPRSRATGHREPLLQRAQDSPRPSARLATSQSLIIKYAHKSPSGRHKEARFTETKCQKAFSL